jgi:hypothetical protein
MIGMLDRLNAPLSRVDENVHSLLGQMSKYNRTHRGEARLLVRQGLTVHQKHGLYSKLP